MACNRNPPIDLAIISPREVLQDLEVILIAHLRDLSPRYLGGLLALLMAATCLLYPTYKGQNNSSSGMDTTTIRISSGSPIRQ